MKFFILFCICFTLEDALAETQRLGQRIKRCQTLQVINLFLFLSVFSLSFSVFLTLCLSLSLTLFVHLIFFEFFFSLFLSLSLSLSLSIFFPLPLFFFLIPGMFDISKFSITGSHQHRQHHHQRVQLSLVRSHLQDSSVRN